MSYYLLEMSTHSSSRRIQIPLAPYILQSSSSYEYLLVRSFHRADELLRLKRVPHHPHLISCYSYYYENRYH